MKKLFYGIGILLAIFSVYYFLLVADKIVYVNGETIYDFEVSDFIDYNQLEKIAKETNTMVQLRTYESISFGNKKLTVQLINPTSNIKEGKQKSIFPQQQIIYHIKNTRGNEKIKYFIIQEDELEKIEKVKQMLEDNGYEFQVMEDEPISIFSCTKLFSPLNFEFFILIWILAVLCITTFYIYRLKEIGILKLNGWNEWKISRKILSSMVICTIISSGIFMILAAIYILIMDSRCIGMYLYMCTLLILFIIAVYFMAAVIAVRFIKNVNQVNAIKNGKNTKFIFYCLIAAKIITTCLFLMGMSSLKEEILLVKDSIKSGKELKSYDFSTIHTAIQLTEEIESELEQLIQTFSDEEVFNYADSEQTYDITSLKGRKINDREYHIAMISDNLISKLHIVDTDGTVLENETLQAGMDKLLVPEHYKSQIEQIMLEEGIESTHQIHYIKDGQIYQSMLSPGTYEYDVIFRVCNVQKTICWGPGEVLLTRGAVKKMQVQLEKMKIDTGSISVVSQSNEIETMIGNEKIMLWQKSLFFAIDVISYMLCTFSIIIIYFEFKKKQFGVYTLQGKIPVKEIFILGIINMGIVFVLALFIDIKFCTLILFELTLYLINVRAYIRKKAVLAIKGE